MTIKIPENIFSLIEEAREKGWRNEAVQITSSKSDNYDIDYIINLEAEKAAVMGAVSCLYEIGKSWPELKINYGCNA